MLFFLLAQRLIPANYIVKEKQVSMTQSTQEATRPWFCSV